MVRWPQPSEDVHLICKAMKFLAWTGASAYLSQGHKMKQSLFIFFCLVMSACSGLQQVMDKNSNALWDVVSSCVQNEQRDHTASPCEQVNLEQGYVVLKDMRGKTQFLVMPTAHASGIESPEILKEGAPNYWQAAWNTRSYVSKRAGQQLPDKDIGLAVNSPFGRTQNQLHIHIDCLKPQVITALKAARRDGKWANINFPHPLHSYQALYVETLTPDPFKRLAAHTKDMSHETLVVAGLNHGFMLLADTATLTDRASGEELLDHECKIAQP
jgi:CDP-diacylglycerol pyrophosphatase